MAKGKRKTIILNPDNPKEKAILDLLDEQYNASEFIKALLFNYIKNNNNLHDGNTMVNVLPHDYHSMTNVLPLNDNTMTTLLPHDDNKMVTQLSSHGNTITTPLSHDYNDNFLIDIGNLSDTEVDINLSALEDPSKNALDFLKNSF